MRLTNSQPIESWRLIDLSMVEPYRAQAFYEAVALAVDRNVSPNTILICQPASPYVCLGFHQEFEKEIDVEHCRNEGLPIIRRSQGGGATYLDSNQIFYQIVARRDSKVIPSKVENLFEKLLNVTVHVYRSLGLPATEFKALNDVITNGKKISGNGAGQFGDNTVILVGNIILDLNYDAMGRVLKVPSEKFRDKMVQSMRGWLTSLKSELGYVPPVEHVKRLLAEGYEKLLGIKLSRSEPSEEEEKIWEEEVWSKHLSPDWVRMGDRAATVPADWRAVKIADGVKVVEVDHKAKKLIRVRAELIGERILDLMFSGDFFMIPEGALHELESNLKGVNLKREEIMKKILEFYESGKVEVPGIAPGDFADAVMKLKKLAETYPPAIYPYAEPRR